MQYNLREHQKHVNRLALLADIEHFRVPTLRRHVAVVVLANGLCYVGESTCHKKDQYKRKIGFNIAVGRALAKAARYDDADFAMAGLQGRELREHLRVKLGLAL